MARIGSRTFTLGELAERLEARLEGDPEILVSGVATLDAAGPEDLTFLTHPRYRGKARETRAAAILVAPDESVEGRPTLSVDRPYVALARVLQWFHPIDPIEPGIDPDARVDPSATVASTARVGPFAVIEAEARIEDGASIGSGCHVGRRASVGASTVLHPRVVVYPDSAIGARCVLHAGVVIGADGFGFATDGDGTHHKIPQVGRVVVEDDVEIGANTAVDRGALEDTVIGTGTKIDDLVMVAHGVRIGPGGLLAAQSGVAGSASTGHHVTLAGQSGVAGHLGVGNRVVVAAKSAVFSDVPDDAFVAGIPAVDHRLWKRAQAAGRRLPELRAEIVRLRERVAEIERRAGHDPPATRSDHR